MIKSNFENSKEYKLVKAYVYLKKARALLKDLQILNYKTDGSFIALMNFCGETIIAHKQGNQDERSVLSKEN